MEGGTRTYTMAARAEAQEQTARRILDAARAAYLEEAYDQVTLARIASDAGVSHQTVLNHFGSKEGVAAAVGHEIGAEIDGIRARVVPGDPESLIAALLEQYERFGDANTRWDLEERLEEIAADTRAARARHGRWLEESFAAWLDGLPAGERRRRLALLFVATDVKTWKLLRRQLGHGRRATGELMLRLVHSAIEGRDTEGRDGS